MTFVGRIRPEQSVHQRRPLSSPVQRLIGQLVCVHKCFAFPYRSTGGGQQATRAIHEPLPIESPDVPLSASQLRPWGVVRHFWSLLVGFSAIVISTRPAAMSGCKTWRLNLVRSVRPAIAISVNKSLSCRHLDRIAIWCRLSADLVPTRTGSCLGA